VGAGSPAATAGLKAGDLLLSANGKAVTCVDDLQRVLVLAGPGEVELGVYRAGRRHQVTALPIPESQAA
jgi:S1-C subfamily serine protease